MPKMLSLFPLVIASLSLFAVPVQGQIERSETSTSNPAHGAVQEGKPSGTRPNDPGLNEAPEEASDLASLRALILQHKEDEKSRDAVHFVTKLADGGDPNASFIMGEYFRTAEGVDEQQKAIVYYEEAAQSGHGLAMLRLGDIYRNGQLIERSIPEAKRYYESAIEAKTVLAYSRLGGLYRDGKGDGLDPAQAIQIYEKGIEAGDDWSMLALGNALAAGSGIAKDVGRARTLFEKSLVIGNTMAPGKLGSLLLSGSIPGASPSDALQLFERGVKMGDPLAAASLADVYREGRFVGKDVTKAAELYRKAIDGGYRGVAWKLGALHQNGEAGLDPSQALGLYQLSVDAGDAWGMSGLADLYREGRLAPENKEKALELYVRAFENGNPDAIARGAAMLSRGNPREQEQAIKIVTNPKYRGAPGLAVVYANAYLTGRGVPKNIRRAIDILTDAASSGDLAAIQRLSLLYLRGASGIKKNPDRALDVIRLLAGKVADDTFNREKLLYTGAIATSPSAIATFAQDVKKLEPRARVELVARIGLLNQTAWLYLVQDFLKAEGLYNGRVNGLLTGPTIKAINGVCRSLGRAKECAKGPFTQETRSVVLARIQEQANW